MSKTLTVIIVALVLGAAFAVFSPLLAEDNTALFNLLLVFFLLALGITLSIRGIVRRSALELVGGIGFTTLVSLLMHKIGHLHLPHAGLLIFVYMMIGSSFAVIQFLGVRNSKVRILWCDVTVSYCCLVGTYVIYFLYDEILVLLLVLLGVLCPSIFYVFNRNRLVREKRSG